MPWPMSQITEAALPKDALIELKNLSLNFQRDDASVVDAMAQFKITQEKLLALKLAIQKDSQEKLADRWADYEHRDKIRDGVVFHVKYLGSTLVSELEEEGQSYGDSISAEAIRTIVHMAKASHKTMTSLTVSPNGIRIVNMETQDVISDLDIHRICFCTADRVHEKVFAYIARNKENETMECHAFLCSKRKIELINDQAKCMMPLQAEDVTLTVAESFQIAKELNEVKLSETTTTTIPTSTSDDGRLQRNVLTASHVPTGTMITSSSTPVELTKSSAYDDNSRPLAEHDLMLFNSSKDLSRLPQF